MGKYVIRPGDRGSYEPPGHQNTTNYPLIDRGMGAEQMEITLGVIQSGGGAHAHAHEKEEQAMYIVEGKIAIDVEGTREEAQAGDIVFFPRGKMHEVATLETPFRVLVIYAPHRENR